jgi:hypothetical protein
VSGSGINRGLKLSWDWAERRCRRCAVFSVFAFRDNDSIADKKWLERRIADYHANGMSIESGRMFSCRKLLEMDKEGKLFNPIVMASSRPGEYSFKRKITAVTIRCPTGGASGGGGSTSADQIFGASVEHVIGKTPPPNWPKGMTGWPSSIATASCSECKKLLKAAREAWSG